MSDTSSFDPRIPNQPVQVRGRPGVTTGRIRQSGTRTYVQVQFAPQEKSFISTEDTEPIDTSKPGVADLVRAKKFGHRGDLARVLTFHKLSSRLANVFYAMQTSRTDFYAYQFKPVYKFIESANGRILIADEVGLGKTIEAGLIWQEVRARSDARTLLVVCPSMLREKWKAELRTRFEVPAQINNSDGFLSLLQDFKREGRGFQCAAVCSLQGLRSGTIQSALEDFADSELQFDLIVVDEAHYMRNVDTQTHRLGKALSGITENFLLLTATPLQLKREELYRLLNVLDPDEYDNHALFEARAEANENVVLAQNTLRRLPPNIQSARKYLAAMTKSTWFSANPLLGLAIDKVEELDPDNVADLIEATRLLEDLNLLGSSISRTRKREVQEWKVIRKARVLHLQYSDQELEFYNSVTDAVRKDISASGNAGFEAFSLMMPQRQMASCIPAMIDHYRGLLDAEESQENAGYELGWVRPEGETIASDKPKVSSEIEGLIANWPVDLPDSKYEALFKEISALFRQETDTKIIVFSYFKKTLSYLARRLSADGYPPLTIHGDVPMDKRLEILKQFEETFEHRVLLSSEVGSEGLDLQFCRVIVNYDLPWNPMKVEQRIGRLDRLGQQSPAISIINIAARGTIEDRILERLFSRIGIFERSIGDLEPILGDMIQQLEFDLLSRRLTPQQEEDRIEQTRLALEQKRKMEADLEDQSQLFFGNSDFVLEQIRDARKTGRWITAAEIRSYVTDFFQKRYAGTQILWDKPESGSVTIDLANSAKVDLASYCRQSEGTSTSLAFNSGATVLVYTSEAANQQPRAEFLTHFHPLIRWITNLGSERERTSAKASTKMLVRSRELDSSADSASVRTFVSIISDRLVPSSSPIGNCSGAGRPAPVCVTESLLSSVIFRLQFECLSRKCQSSCAVCDVAQRR